MVFNRLTIGPKLLLIFLIIGIVPAIFIGGISVWQSRAALSELVYNQLESQREVKKAQIEDFFAERRSDMSVLLDMVATLRNNAWQKLNSVQENKIAQIEDYFQRLRNDIRILSRTEAVAQAIEQFSEAMELDGMAGGMAWESIQGMLNKELQHYKTTLGYDDFLLIDHQGRVVYTAQRGDDFGLDLLDEANEENPLAAPVKTVLMEKRLTFRDFTPYEPADNRQVMFALGPVWRFEKLVGVMVFRVAPHTLEEIVHRNKGMGKTGESYLVGRVDEMALYRSNRKDAGVALGSPASGEDVKKALSDEEGMLIKYDQEELRLSAYDPLNLEDLSWALISSVDVEEILTPRLELANQDFFEKYLKEFDYDDLYLIHAQGKIFYSVKRREDYNTNVLTGDYADTLLGEVTRRVMDTQTLQITDYAPYAPNGGKPMAFIAVPLLNHEGALDLVVAVQLNDNALSRIMLQRSGLGEEGETYLVGEDRLLRSDSHRAPERYTTEASFADPENSKILTRAVTLALRGEEGRMLGRNYLDQKVLTAYQPIVVGDMTWALIADRGTTEAFQQITTMQYGIALIALVGMAVVWYFSIGFTANLVKPLRQLNNQLKILAQGEPVEKEIEYQGQDEIAELLESSRRLKNGMDATILQANAVAAGDYSQEVKLRSERDRLGKALSDMTWILRQATATNAAQDWLKTGLAAVNDKMRGTQNVATLGKNVIDVLVNHLDAKLGLFYIYHETQEFDTDNVLKLTASYAFTRRKGLSTEYPVGEGIVGQAALERELILVDELPEDYVAIQSGAGHASPRNLVVVPMFYEDRLQGAIELASFHAFSDAQLDFLRQAAPAIAIGIYTAQSRGQLEDLLAQSQSQAEELQSQSEELEVQQEELRQSNEELEERTQELERQKNEIRDKNDALESAKSAIEQKAEELELASKYKSEFLANMSHELRTPLNSLLILAQMLSNNKDGNLSDKQVEYARTIHNAGSDLLNLINEILDLSKIEAGKIELQPEEFRLEDTVILMEQRFRHMAEDKGLHFVIDRAADLPATTFNDSQRLQQVLTNLLSNAFKFTSKGGTITLGLRHCTDQDDLNGLKLAPGKDLALSVRDTGIGIPKEKQPQIFEAFQQADGSTSRKYGGTGLGLSITRQLVQLMGGAIRLHSEPGEGSTFTILIPARVAGHASADSPFQALAEATLHAAPTPAAPPRPAPTPAPVEPRAEPPAPFVAENAPEVEDDRDNLQPGDRLLLVIEDDPNFASLLIELAHEKQFKCLFAHDGATGLQLAQTHLPQAIVLDIGLPQVDGLTVVERLKNNPDTRHIPIHCVSGQEQDMDARKMGAIGYLLKPVGIDELSDAFRKIEKFINNEVRNLLLLADSDERKNTLARLIDNDSVDIAVAADREQALAHLRANTVDCLVLDAGLESDGRLELLGDLRRDESIVRVPVILFAERDLTEAEEAILQQSTEKLVIKSVQSPERLLDETTLFLHQVEAKLPQEQQQILHRVHDQKEAILSGKKVLVVDDDVRNIYSLTAILEEKDMDVFAATDGKRALSMLEEEPDIHIVLMDIMMPEMDGYETMRRIRGEGHKKLPIIALTAKAMKGDKAKCIEAGANDYLAKPVDTDKLLSLMRVWLYT